MSASCPTAREMSYEINVVTGWSDWVQAVEIMAQNLEEIGIKATVQPYDFAAWIEKVQKGDFDISIGWSTGGATPFNFYRGQMSAADAAKPVGRRPTRTGTATSTRRPTRSSTEFAATSDEAEQEGLGQPAPGRSSSRTCPAIPLFPGPQWGEFNTMRFTDFPNEENPYAVLSTWAFAERLITMTTIKPVPSCVRRHVPSPAARTSRRGRRPSPLALVRTGG